MFEQSLLIRCLRRVFAAIVLAGVAGPVLLAAVTPVRAQLSADTLLSAVVGLAVNVAPDARTAATLGTERAGSGIVIDDQGLVLTIGYLLLEADEITATTSGGKTLPALPVAYSGDTGFGLVRIQGSAGTRPLKLGDSDGIAEGQALLVASFGGTRGVRPAFVTQRREFAGPWEYLLDKAIFTTPPHPAFGGAGLVSDAGDLLGIGYLIVGNAGGSDTPVPGNMFVPINALKPILSDLVAHGRPPGPVRPWLGLYTAEARGRLVVERVASGGPAEEAGLKTGDIVLTVDNEPVTSMADFYRKIWALGPAGTVVPVTVLQGPNVRQLEVPSIDRTRWFRSPRTY